MDAAREWTDQRLLEMEKRLRQIYSQSYAEISAKWNDYMTRGQERLDVLYNAYLSAPANQKADALKRYQDAVQNYTLRNRWYQDMVNETTFRLAHVNEIALAYIAGQIPAIYARNFNQIDPDALLVRPNWTLRNEHMIRNLIQEDKLRLPHKEVDYPKDMAWNAKQINNAVLQGVLQGESIPKIAARLLPIVNNNRKAATRTARTMVTGAENRGRRDRYRDYEDQGLVINKIWLATPDGRTRDWHLSMDGQEVPTEDPFIDGLGNELEYPGDDEAPPETVYNCRCSMKSHIIGVRNGKGKVTPIKDYKSDSFHSDQMAAERARREAQRAGDE